MNTKQFTGFLASTTNPGQLSLTMQSLTKAVLSFAALWAVIHGLDTQAVTTQVQSVIDTVATAVTAGMAFYHSVMVAYGLAHKVWFALAAKPVVTVPAAVPVAVETSAS
jgi:hypothetical protein